MYRICHVQFNFYFHRTAFQESQENGCLPGEVQCCVLCLCTSSRRSSIFHFHNLAKAMAAELALRDEQTTQAVALEYLGDLQQLEKDHDFIQSWKYSCTDGSTLVEGVSMSTTFKSTVMKGQFPSPDIAGRPDDAEIHVPRFVARCLAPQLDMDVYGDELKEKVKQIIPATTVAQRFGEVAHSITFPNKKTSVTEGCLVLSKHINQGADRQVVISIAYYGEQRVRLLDQHTVNTRGYAHHTAKIENYINFRLYKKLMGTLKTEVKPLPDW